MKHAHTPGPWHVKEQYRSETTMQPPYWDVCTRREDGRDTIYETVAENCGPEDARLIAAAPELLAALERISTAYDETLRHPIATELLRAIYQSRAAIAKAKWGAEGGAE